MKKLIFAILINLILLWNPIKAVYSKLPYELQRSINENLQLNESAQLIQTSKTIYHDHNLKLIWNRIKSFYIKNLGMNAWNLEYENKPLNVKLIQEILCKLQDYITLKHPYDSLFPKESKDQSSRPLIRHQPYWRRYPWRKSLRKKENLNYLLSFDDIMSTKTDVSHHMLLHDGLSPELQQFVPEENIEDMNDSLFKPGFDIQDYYLNQMTEKGYDFSDFDIWVDLLNEYKEKANKINQENSIIRIIYNDRNTTAFEPDAGLAAIFIYYISCYRHDFRSIKSLGELPNYHLSLMATLKHFWGTEEKNLERINKLKAMILEGCRNIELFTENNDDIGYWKSNQKILRPLEVDIEIIFNLLREM